MKRFALALAVLVACGGDDDGGPLTVDNLPGAVASAYCSAFVRCGVISDVTTCRGLNLDLDFGDAELNAAVHNGSVIFNETEARLCIGGFGSTCESGRLFDENEHCALAFEGTVAAGGSCGIDEQCVSQNCQTLSCPDACCPGTCVGDTPPTRPRLGESCATDFNCLDSFCDPATEVCTAFLGVGQSCTAGSQCAQGYCNGVCTRYPGAGEPCTGGEVGCGDIGLTCGAGGVCVEYALEGDPCSSTMPCSPVYQCNGSVCELGPRLGEACGQQDRGCIDESYCDPATLRCTAPQPDGTQCQSSTQCINDCDFNTQTCASPPICI